MFRRRQVFVKWSSGPVSQLSGIVTSETNWAQLQGTGVFVTVYVGVNEGARVPVGVTDGMRVLVAVLAGISTVAVMPGPPPGVLPPAERVCHWIAISVWAERVWICCSLRVGAACCSKLQARAAKPKTTAGRGAS